MKLWKSALLLGALALAPPAGAQTWRVGPDPVIDRYESPQNFAVELRFSPWQPDIDGEFGGRARPFLNYFGEPDPDANNALRVRDRLLFAAEVDWQALRLGPAASLGVGVGLGYSALSANAPVTGSNAASGQQSTLNVLPGYAVAVLRLDVLARRTVVPLVVYGKAGVAATYWWITAGDNLSRRNSLSPSAPDGASDLGRAATGFSYGWQLAAGLMLRLDWLEPRAQRAWDVEMGVNHSYLFAEYMVVRDWDRAQLHMGSNTWAFGVAFEF